ncbi:CMGC/SRPK protein kinase, partial [Puccinia sorghi]
MLFKDVNVGIALCVRRGAPPPYPDMDTQRVLQGCCAESTKLHFISDYAHEPVDDPGSVWVNMVTLESALEYRDSLCEAISIRTSNRQEVPAGPPGLQFVDCAILCLACYEYLFCERTMKVSNSFCNKTWHILAQVSASCSPGLSKWLLSCMSGRTAAGYSTAHSLALTSEDSIPSLSSVHRFKANQAQDWEVTVPSEPEAEGYLHLEDLILS